MYACRSLLSTQVFSLCCRKYAAFQPIEAKDAESMRRLIHAFHKAIKSASNEPPLKYFIVFGTLLGSYRHHGRIPWDDDIDVMFPISDKERVKRVLSTADPEYGLHTEGVWRFYPRDGILVSHSFRVHVSL